MCVSQFSCLHIDRIHSVYLVKYLPSIGQQLVQVIDVSPAIKQQQFQVSKNFCQHGDLICHWSKL